jgi:hypothetical protein
MNAKEYLNRIMPEGHAFGKLILRPLGRETAEDYDYAIDRLCAMAGVEAPDERNEEELVKALNALVDFYDVTASGAYRTDEQMLVVEIGWMGMFQKDDWTALFDAVRPLLWKGSEVVFTAKDGRNWTFWADENMNYCIEGPDEAEERSTL